ncbi:MAG: hypothetical protein HQ481_21170 [Alphaproteobacteria bacterium]|nr:hypothetical protein [Alphaproteobacteria bacterium]
MPVSPSSSSSTERPNVLPAVARSSPGTARRLLIDALLGAARLQVAANPRTFALVRAWLEDVTRLHEGGATSFMLKQRGRRLVRHSRQTDAFVELIRRNRLSGDAYRVIEPEPGFTEVHLDPRRTKGQGGNIFGFSAAEGLIQVPDATTFADLARRITAAAPAAKPRPTSGQERESAVLKALAAVHREGVMELPDPAPSAGRLRVVLGSLAEAAGLDGELATAVTSQARKLALLLHEVLGVVAVEGALPLSAPAADPVAARRDGTMAPLDDAVLGEVVLALRRRHARRRDHLTGNPHFAVHRTIDSAPPRAGVSR